MSKISIFIITTTADPPVSVSVGRSALSSDWSAALRVISYACAERSEKMASSCESSENSESFLRKRRADALVSDSLSHDSCSETVQDEDSTKYGKKVGVSLQSGTYWLTRIVLLRAIAFLYCEFDRWRLYRMLLLGDQTPLVSSVSYSYLSVQ